MKKTTWPALIFSSVLLAACGGGGGQPDPAITPSPTPSGDTTAPAVPAGLVATAVSPAQINLTWPAATDNVAVTGYDIYRNESKVGTSLVPGFNDTGRTPGTTYRYEVAAHDAAGNTSARSSPPVSATTPAASGGGDTTPPAVPTDLTASANSSSQIQLSWTASTDNVGVAGYNVYRDDAKVGTATVAGYTDTGLSPSTAYAYKVAAFDAAGNASSPSTAVNATTPVASADAVPPSVPTRFAANVQVAPEIDARLTWTASTDNVGVVGYHVYRDGAKIASVPYVWYSDLGLTPNKQYSYTIAAYDAAGNTSAQVTPVAVGASAPTSTDTAPPSKPVNVKATMTDPTTVQLAWDRSTDNVGVVGYRVYEGGTLVTTLTYVSASWNNVGRTPGTTYKYTVSAFDKAGNASAPSDLVTITTPAATAADTQPPTTPGALSATALSPSSIQLTWNTSTDNTRVYGYVVYRNAKRLTAVKGTRFVDTGLASGTNYSYSVAAFDPSSNTSAHSAPANATTQGTKPAADVFTTFSLSSPVGQPAAPFTLGHAFRKGDVPSGKAIVANIPRFQAIVKSRWQDGSVQFAILSGSVDLAANTPVAVELRAGTAPSTGAALTEADLAATGANAQIGFSGIGTVELSSLIGHDSHYDATRNQWVAGKTADWIKGPEMSSWIYCAPLGADPGLVGWYEVRLYKGGKVEILPWIENGFVMKTSLGGKTGTASVSVSGSSRFSMGLEVRHHTRAVLASGTTFSHWLGTDPQVTFKHDVQYMQKTKLVPTYIARTQPDSPAFAPPGAAPCCDWVGLYTSYTPFAQSAWPSRMGAPGYDVSIGNLPEWDALYLTGDADPRAWSAVQVQAYTAGRYGIHYRDEKTNRAIKASSYPLIAINPADNSGVGGGSTSDGTAYTAAAAGNAPPLWEGQHPPSMGYMAYLVMGRYYFMEEAQFVAALEYMRVNTDRRQNAKGIMDSRGALSERGAAWALRDLAYGLMATPDDDPLKPSIQALVDNNAQFYFDTYAARPSCPWGFLQSLPMSDESPGDQMAYVSIFTNDFFTGAFGRMIEMGVFSPAVADKAKTFFAWNAQHAIGRLGDPNSPGQYDFRDATPYVMTIAPSDTPDWTTGTGPWYANWGDVYRVNFGNAVRTAPANQLRGGYFPGAAGFWGNLQPAISLAVDAGVPGAQDAYLRMTGASNWPQFMQDANDRPIWAVMPASLTPQ